MTTKLRLTLNTLRANVRLTQWPVMSLDPLDDYEHFVEQAYKEKFAIGTNEHLAPKGKRAAKVYSGDMGNSFGPKGFSIGSNRHASSSK